MILKTIKYMTMFYNHVDGFYWLKGLPIMRDQRSTVPSMRDQLVHTPAMGWTPAFSGSTTCSCLEWSSISPPRPC